MTLPSTATSLVLVAAAAALLALAAYALTRPGGAGDREARGAPSGPATPAASATAAPDVSAVRHPVRCGDLGTVVERQASGDVTGDGVPEVAVAVRCDSGAGSPPHAVLLYGRGEGPSGVRLLATLVRTDAAVLVQSLVVRPRTVEVSGVTYSGGDVPRCCPDERFEARWRWDGTKMVAQM